MSFRDQLNQFVNEYIDNTKEEFSGHPIGILVRNKIPHSLYEGVVDSSKYLVKGSIGQGNWATNPWICIFDRRITTSATKGVYIVYLLSKDGERLYLTLNQGCTELRNRMKKTEAVVSELRRIASDIQLRIDCGYFDVSDEIDLGDDLPVLSKLYEQGTICFRRYNRGQLPDQDSLLADLEEMMAIYARYSDQYLKIDMGHMPSVADGGAPYGDQDNDKDKIEFVKQYISSKGFFFDDDTIENFFLSLKSKPFVILAGISGTGKTRLVKLFAEAIGANVANGRFKLVPVRPDWSDSTDLFGHTDLNGHFIPGSLIDFIYAASEDLENPYLLCLDEMNLARVEYYLSDFLSIMETRDINQEGYIETDQLLHFTYFGSDREAAEKYRNLRFTQNLYVVGTVNMDETTFPFSRKVLDRANTIELSHVNLLPDSLLSIGKELEPLDLDNDFLKAEYVQLIQCKSEYEYVYDICQELEQLNAILEKVGFKSGYRVRDEVVFYMLNNKKMDLLNPETAFDYQILQKILPRIQGSSVAIKDMLADLFQHIVGDYEGYQTTDGNIGDKMFERLKEGAIRYPKSAQKIAFMVRRFEEDGFTSYWL